MRVMRYHGYMTGELNSALAPLTNTDIELSTTAKENTARKSLGVLTNRLLEVVVPVTFRRKSGIKTDRLIRSSA